MKITLISVLVSTCGIVPVQTNEVIANVKSSVAKVVSSLPTGNAGSTDYLCNFGLRTRELDGYWELVEIVSNNQDIVCHNFNNCATNEISRMILLSAWWGGDDALYLSGLSRSLDMAISGILTREDVEWYRSGHRNERRGNILALRYDEPGVSNLVTRYYCFLGETNVCDRILSGEARRSIMEYFEDVSSKR